MSPQNARLKHSLHHAGVQSWTIPWTRPSREFLGFENYLFVAPGLKAG